MAKKEKEPSDEIVRATSLYSIPLWVLPQKEERDAEGKAKKHWPGKCQRSDPDACQACRMLHALQQAQQEVTRGMNAAIRQHFRTDSDLLDAFQVLNGRMPGKGEISWPAVMKKDGGVYTYETIRKVVPALSSHIAAAIQKAAAEYWKRYRFETLIKQERRAPGFTESPIPLPKDSVRLTQEGKRFRLQFSLQAGGGQILSLLVEPRDARQERELKALMDGTWRRGSMQILQDSKRYSRWFFRISYKRKKPATPSPERVMGINRGIRCFLAWSAFDGSSDYDAGTDIVSTLKGFQRRRRAYQHQYKWSNRRGHGKTRSLRPIERLEGKGERWRANTCQTRARAITRICIEKKISLVGIEDLTGIRDKIPEHLEGGERVYVLIQEWPYFQLQSRIIACLEEAGIRYVILPPRYISQECPECRFTSPANIDWKEHWFRCRKCNHSRHLDVVAATNIRDRVREHLAGFTPPGPARNPPTPTKSLDSLPDDDEVLIPAQDVPEERKGTARKRRLKDV